MLSDCSESSDLQSNRVLPLDFFRNWLLTGVYDPVSIEDIRSMYEHQCPISSLSGDERARLNRSLEDLVLLERYLFPFLERLTEDDYAFISPEFVVSGGECPEVVAEPLSHGKNVLIDISLSFEGGSRFDLAKEFVLKNGAKLQGQQKIALLSNPDLMEKTVVIDAYHHGEELFSFRSDNASLSQYGFSVDEFLELERGIRRRTGKAGMFVMDVGGGTGKALKDAKTISPSITTCKLVSDDEMVSHPVDRTILAQAEMMPAYLEESVDLIISRDAFMWMAYPDIAFMNSIKALSVGGEARIGLSTHQNRLTMQDELCERFGVLIAELRKLEENGLIKVEIPQPGAAFPGVAYLRQRASVVKLKSTMGAFSR